MNPRKIYSTLFFLTCLSALTWQLYEVFLLYCQYQVKSTTKLFIPEVINSLPISLCVYIYDILDLDRLNKETQRSWSHPYSFILGDKNNWYPFNLTISQLFQYTPTPAEVITGFRYMKSSSLKHNDWRFSPPRSESNLLKAGIQVERHLYLSMICYQVSLNESQKLMFSDVASGISPGLISGVFYSQQVRRSRGMVLFIGDSNGRKPLVELQNTPFFLTGYNVKEDKKLFNCLTVEHSMMKTQLLPPPYETKCFDYGRKKYYNEVDCREECMTRETWNKLHRVHHMTFVREDYESRHDSRIRIDTSDILSNASLEKELFEIAEYCRKMECNKISCHHSSVITNNIKLSWNDFYASDETSYIMRHLLPTQHYVETSSTPSISIVELIIYILGSVSTWTGLSILDFNPVSIIFRIKRFCIRYEKHHLTSIKDKKLERMNHLLESVQSRLDLVDRNERENELRFYTLEQKLKRVVITFVNNRPTKVTPGTACDVSKQIAM